MSVGKAALHTIDQRLRHVLENDLPFGGKKLIFVGDFFQLPPVLDTPLYSEKVAPSHTTFLLIQ